MHHYFKFFFILFLFLFSTMSFSQPPDTVRGKLIFIGKTNDLTHSVWLSLTTAGAFNLEAQGGQLIDQWDKTANGAHLSLSPIVSQGNGGTHFLINRENNRILDSQNQKGGIILPPLPSEPPDVTPPTGGVPEHPIVTPPGSTPPGGTPEHPIVTPPGANQPGAFPPNKNSPTSPSDQDTSDDGTDRQIAPITRGRQFEQKHLWNIWSDNRYFNSHDERHDINAKGNEIDFSIGADRYVLHDLVLGLMLTLNKYNYTALDEVIKNRASGLSAGPYFGYTINSNWSIDGAITYGQLHNNNDLAILNSTYRTQLFHEHLRATGLFHFSNFQLRPKPLISFTHFRNPSYQFTGMLRNRPLKIFRESENFNFNYVEFRLEGNYTKSTQTGNIVQPYAEAGIDYIFKQPNDGQILTGNLTLARVSPVTGTITAGMRTIFSKVFLIDVSGSYFSVGQHGLDVWGVRLLASYSFG